MPRAASVGWSEGPEDASASKPVAMTARATADAAGGRPAPGAAGLSCAEALRRLAEFGPNEIRHERTTSAAALAARQFASPVIWLLLGASVVSAALGEWLDASAIGA